MFSAVRRALARLSVGSARQVGTGPKPGDKKADFHAKYGLLLLVSGGAFCLATWREALSQLELARYPTLHRRVRPKPWKKA